MLHATGDFGSSPRLRSFAAACAWTLLVALPTGLMGWVCAYGLELFFGIQSNRPLWFLPFWCLGLFCCSLKHYTDLEKRRANRNFEERWDEAERNIGLAA